MGRHKGDAGEYLDEIIRKFADSSDREGFILFIPFRSRTDLMSLKKEIFDAAKAKNILLESLDRLRLSLALLKNVTRVTAFEAPSLAGLGEARELFSASAEGGATLSRPKESDDPFEARLERKVRRGDQSWVCRGAEIFDPGNKILQNLKNSPEWPLVPVTEEKQKAAPHAAIMIVGEEGKRGKVLGRWVSFLPLSESSQADDKIVFSLGGDGESRSDILAHGFFFLKSDRKRVAGLTDYSEGIEARWNRAILEQLIAPLAPGALYEYLSVDPEAGEVARALKKWLKRAGVDEQANSRDNLAWDAKDGKWILARAPVYPLPSRIPPRIAEWLKGRKETFIAEDRGLYSDKIISKAAPDGFLASMLKFMAGDIMSIDETELDFVDALLSMKPYDAEAEERVRQWLPDLLKAGLYSQKKGAPDKIKECLRDMAERYLDSDLLFPPMATEPALRRIARERPEALKAFSLLPDPRDRPGRPHRIIPSELYAYLGASLKEDENQSEADIALADFLTGLDRFVPEDLKLFRVAIFKNGKRLYGDKDAARGMRAIREKESEELLFKVPSSDKVLTDKLLECYSVALDPEVEIWRRRDDQAERIQDPIKILYRSINRNLTRLSRGDERDALIKELLNKSADETPEGRIALRGLLAGADPEPDAILAFGKESGETAKCAGFYFIHPRWKDELNGAQRKRLRVLDEKEAKEKLAIRILADENPHKQWKRVKALCPDYDSLHEETKQWLAEIDWMPDTNETRGYSPIRVLTADSLAKILKLPPDWTTATGLYKDQWLEEIRRKIAVERPTDYEKLFADKNFVAPKVFFPAGDELWPLKKWRGDVAIFAKGAESAEEKLLARVLNCEADIQRKFAGQKPNFKILLNLAAKYYANNREANPNQGIIQYAFAAIKADPQIFKGDAKFPARKAGVWKTGREIAESASKYGSEYTLEKNLWDLYWDWKNREAFAPDEGAAIPETSADILERFFNNKYCERLKGYLAQFCALIAGADEGLKKLARKYALAAQSAGGGDYVKRIREQNSSGTNWDFSVRISVEREALGDKSLAGTPLRIKVANENYFSQDPKAIRRIGAKITKIHKISLLADQNGVCIVASEDEAERKLKNSLDVWLDCLGLALNTDAWKSAASPQASLEEIKRHLRADIGVVCKILKIANNEEIKNFIGERDAAIGKDFMFERQRSEKALYEAARQCPEILTKTREYIERMGYGASGILLELLPNADDAIGQREKSKRYKTVKVELKDGVLKLRHRGRPINDGQDGAAYRRDLYNMLTLNASEKAGGETGRLGLGFKSAFLVCDEPRVRSGVLSFKIENALFPELLKMEEIDRVADYDETVFALPLRRDADEEEIFSRLGPAAPLIPVFARHIETLTLNKNGREEIFRFERNDPGDKSAWVSEDRENGFLCFYMVDDPDAAVAVKIDGDGLPVETPEETPPLWHTMPMLEGVKWKFGCAINAPFHMDAGRARFGDDPENREILRKIGEILGDLLLELWKRKKSEDPESREKFNAALWRVLATGARKEMESSAAWTALVKNLHAGGRGLSAWLSSPGVIGSGVPEKWSWPLTAIPDKWYSCELHSEKLERIFEELKKSHSANLSSFAFVSPRAAEILELLDFKVERLRKAAFFDKLFSCLTTDGRLSPEIFKIISSFKNDINQISQGERGFSKNLSVRTRAGSWERLAKVLLPPDPGDGYSERKNELLLSAFAPDSRVLDKNYISGKEDASFYFALRGKRESAPSEIVDWIEKASESRRAAILRYLSEGDDIKLTIKAIRDRRIDWLEDAKLVENLCEENGIDYGFYRANYGDKFLSEADADRRVEQAVKEDRESQARADDAENEESGKASIDPSEYLKQRLEAWKNNSDSIKNKYRQNAYAAPYCDDAIFREKLNGGDRRAWLTLWLTGCLQSVGRTQPTAIKNFVKSFSDDYSAYFDQALDPMHVKWLEFICKFEDMSKFRIEYLNFIGVFPFFHQLSRFFKQYATQFGKAPFAKNPVGVLAARGYSGFSGGGKNFDSPPFPSPLGKYFILRELCRLDVGDCRRGGYKFFEYCWTPRRACVDKLGLAYDDEHERRRERIVTVLTNLNHNELPIFNYWFDIALCPY